MKKGIRKCITLVLVLTLVLSMAGITSANGFAGHWAEEILTKWLENGWVKGYPDGSLNPDQTVTRAEYVSMVNRALNLTMMKDTHNYTDMPDGVWYEEEVLKAMAAGYLSGEGILAPGEMMTRQEAALMLFKALRLWASGDISLAGQFTDGNQIRSEHIVRICALIQHGILVGYEDDTLRLGEVITRAEAMAMISRALQVKEELEEAAKNEVVSPVISSVQIMGDSNITIPAEGYIEVPYSAVVRDQYDQPISYERVTWSVVDEVYGVSVDADSGVVTITDQVNAQGFTLKAVARNYRSVYTTKMISFASASGVSGYITNAVDGSAVNGLTVEILDDGEVIAETETDTSGFFEFRGLRVGTYTIRITGEGFVTITDTITVEEDGSGPFRFVVPPALGAGQFRIVLTWGATPADLDSHLEWPTPSGGTFHVYYSNRRISVDNVTYVELDIDDTSGYGPETTTIYNQSEETYTFYVYNYSNENTLANSGAKVEVYMGSEKVATFLVPTNHSSRYWYVFNLNGTEVTPYIPR